MKRLYQASGQRIEEVLKKERIEWHPDRFARCPPSSRDMIQAKAAEIFKIIQQLEGEKR